MQQNANLTSAQLGAALIASLPGQSHDAQLGFGLVDADGAVGLLR